MNRLWRCGRDLLTPPTWTFSPVGNQSKIAKRTPLFDAVRAKVDCVEGEQHRLLNDEVRQRYLLDIAVRADEVSGEVRCRITDLEALRFSHIHLNRGWIYLSRRYHACFIPKVSHLSVGMTAMTDPPMYRRDKHGRGLDAYPDRTEFGYLLGINAFGNATYGTETEATLAALNADGDLRVPVRERWIARQFPLSEAGFTPAEYVQYVVDEMGE